MVEVLAPAHEARDRLPHPVVPARDDAVLGHARNEDGDRARDRLVHIANTPGTRLLRQTLALERDVGDLLVALEELRS
jgi:hypothetical protein